jgi:hypothetical protein
MGSRIKPRITLRIEANRTRETIESVLPSYNQARQEGGNKKIDRYEKGGKAMRKRLDRNSAIILGLLGFAALLFALAPTPARAVGTDPCANVTLVDNDQDGFWDCYETNSLVNPCGQAPDTPVSSSKKDLFVFLVRMANSNMVGFDPFALAKTSLASVVNIHVIDIENPSCSQLLIDRIVSSPSPQKAVKITEDPSRSVVEVGSSTPGVPSGPDEAKIYTNRIWDKLVAACPCIATDSCGSYCKATSGETGKATLYQFYIQNTIAHEIGHIIRPLHQPYTTQYEYHYVEGSGWIMDRAIVATTNKKTKVVTIPISKNYGSTDIGNVKLLP